MVKKISPEAVSEVTQSPEPHDAGESAGAKPPAWYRAIADADDEGLKRAVATRIQQILEKHGLSEYLTLLLFDEIDPISNFHADRLYASASAHSPGTKDILLILHSRGGSIEPAYLLSKTLKRFSRGKFAVAVPRRAKSAATLICLGADEIHVGMMSELGPIDPQFGGLPALALANALDLIADLACRFPNASDVLSRYLSEQLPIRMLGYYQRVSESAVQYAERLLTGKTLAEGKKADDVARHLVNHYKDHSFVIDYDEAQSLLGDHIVKHGTVEYRAADEIFRFLDLVTMLVHPAKELWHVGSIEDDFYIRPKQKKEST
jgi:hypothetical protein